MTYYKLFSNCFPVKGELASIIYDVTRETFHTIPNSLFEILASANLISFDQLKEKYLADIEILDEYLEFLLLEDLIFECPQEEFDNFPLINLSWEYPAFITNAVIELNPEKIGFLEKALRYLDELGCRFIQIKWNCFSLQKAQMVFEFIEKNRFNSIEIIIENSQINQFERQKLIDQMNNSNRGFRLVIENCNEVNFKRINECKDLLIEIMGSYLELKRKEKGSFFKVNMDLFLESQTYNNYLKRKLFIRSDGEIKNTKNSVQSFGKIQDLLNVQNLKDIVQSDLFQLNWEITKDQLKECSTCEFRYMCVDDRDIHKMDDGSLGFIEPCSFRKSINDQLV